MFRDDYRQAAQFLVTTVEEVPDDAWEKPALGVWTVRDLVGHATRALLTVEAYSERPAESRVVSGPADYFMRALGMLANHAATDQRGRETGQALGDNPKAAVREIAERVLDRIQLMPDDFLLAPPTGGVRLSRLPSNADVGTDRAHVGPGQGRGAARASASAAAFNHAGVAGQPSAPPRRGAGRCAGPHRARPPSARLLRDEVERSTQ